ncbi:MAG: hypothetical protein HZA19_00190 [Nitrospirae bacterium]|nr:hypothetical protein [Nitrospirota bacterium]
MIPLGVKFWRLLPPFFSIGLILFFHAPALSQPAWHIIPSLRLSETYDSNLFSREVGGGDYLTQAGVNLTPLYTGPNVSLRGNYLVQMQTYARHPGENRIIQDGSVEMDLNRWFQRWVKAGEVSLTEDFTFTPLLQDYYFDEERRQVGSLSSLGIRTQRTDTLRNAFSLAFSVPATPRWTIRSLYRNLLTEYKDPVLVDSITHSLLIGSDVAFVRNTLYANLESSRIRWKKEDSYSHRLSLGARHTFSREWKMDLHAGVLRFDSEGEKNRDTWIGGLTLSRQDRYHTISMGYSRTINPAAGIGTHPPIAQLFHANWTTMFTPKITSSLGGSYTINTALLGTDLDTRSYRVTAGMAYQVNQWLQANLTASHFNQDSNTPLADSLQREMVSLTLIGTWE